MSHIECSSNFNMIFNQRLCDGISLHKTLKLSTIEMGEPLVSRAENRQKEAGMSPTAAPINQKFCILVTFVDYLHNKFQVPTSYRSTFSRCLFYRQTHRHTRTLDLDSRDLNTCFGPEKTDHRKFRSNTLLSFLYGTRKLKKKIRII